MSKYEDINNSRQYEMKYCNVLLHFLRFYDSKILIYFYRKIMNETIKILLF